MLRAAKDTPRRPANIAKNYFIVCYKVGYQIMELKAAGWIGIKQMIWGAGQHILDKETRCALVRFIDIMEQRHHIEWEEWLEIYIIAGEYVMKFTWIQSKEKWNFREIIYFFPDDGLFFDVFWRFCLGSGIISNWWGFSLEVLNCLTSLVVETKRVTNT